MGYHGGRTQVATLNVGLTNHPIRLASTDECRVDPVGIDLRWLQVECVACARSSVLDGTILEAKLGEPLSPRNVAALWRRFRCSGCGGKRVRVADAGGTLLIDPDHLVRCEACALPILLPRLAAAPGTRRCIACQEADERDVAGEPYPTPPTELQRCQHCGERTIVRENSGTGDYFIGCLAFPKCRWTAPLPADRIPQR